MVSSYLSPNTWGDSHPVGPAEPDAHTAAAPALEGADSWAACSQAVESGTKGSCYCKEAPVVPCAEAV